LNVGVLCPRKSAYIHIDLVKALHRVAIVFFRERDVNILAVVKQAASLIRNVKDGIIAKFRIPLSN